MEAFRTILVAGVAGIALGAAAAPDEPDADKQKEPPGEADAGSRAQSGAAAAEEATLYLAQLKRCEGLAGAQRETCVDVARKRPGHP